MIINIKPYCLEFGPRFEATSVRGSNILARDMRPFEKSVFLKIGWSLLFQPEKQISQ